MLRLCKFRQFVSLVVVILMLCFGLEPGIQAADEPPSQRQSRYMDEGERLYRAFTDGCHVALGVLTEVGPRCEDCPESSDKEVLNRRVKIYLTEWIWGKPAETMTELHTTQVTEIGGHKSSYGAWSAWEGVTVEEGHELLIVWWEKKALESQLLWKPGPEVLVTDNQSKINQIRKIADLFAKYKAKPGEFASLFQQALDVNSSPLDAMTLGFAFALIQHTGWKQGDEGARWLVWLLNMNFKQLDPQAYLWGLFYQLTQIFGMLSTTSPQMREVVLQQIIQTACSGDLVKAGRAIACLRKLCEFNLLKETPGLSQRLSSDQKRLLSERYQSLVSQKKFPRSLSFENQCGLISFVPFDSESSSQKESNDGE
ncbi:MAG TPA: hypothetical protein PKZ53_01785 [Acidobacteriota bacterium]|nr:hypothetical protein [Acidobacteriota bacterium]